LKVLKLEFFKSKLFKNEKKFKIQNLIFSKFSNK
jgi:hypothetical protein